MQDHDAGLNFYRNTMGALLVGLPLTIFASEASIQCEVNVVRSFGVLGVDRFTESLRIDIVESSNYLSISGEGKNFKLKIDSRQHGRTRYVANDSSPNEWKISRTDEQGEAISAQRLAIDRNTGKIIYEASLRRQDGTLRPSETTLSGDCNAIDTAKRRF